MSSRHRFRELSSRIRPSWTGRDGVGRGGKLASNMRCPAASRERFCSFHREQAGVHCLAESPNRMWKRQSVRVIICRYPKGRAPRRRLPWKLPRVDGDRGPEVAEAEAVVEDVFVGEASWPRGWSLEASFATMV